MSADGNASNGARRRTGAGLSPRNWRASHSPRRRVEADNGDDIEKDRRTHNGRVWSIERLCMKPCRRFMNAGTRFFRRRQPCHTASFGSIPVVSVEPCRTLWTKITHGIFHKDRRVIYVAAIVVILGALFVMVWRCTAHGHPLRMQSDRVPLLLGLLDFSKVDDIGGWMYSKSSFPSLKSLEPLAREKIPYFGELRILPTVPEQFQRTIDPQDAEAYERYRLKLLESIDDERMIDKYYHDDELDPQCCRRPNWRSSYFPSCNSFHEMDLSRPYKDHAVDNTYDSYYFNHGYYRDSWMLRNPMVEDSIVLKMTRYKFTGGYKEFYRVQRDAIVMERLTSSPRIINIYGHCGTSVGVEPMAYEVEEYIVPGTGYVQANELDDKNDVHPRNTFSETEKLEMALSMAESIADLHGFQDGVIVHDDIQLCQWLRTKDDKLVLGDFNRAEIMNWNEHKQEYCTYSNGLGYGNYRAPEEFEGGQLNEKIDVYSMGNNIYALLTGLWVFYENEDDGVVQKKVMEGARPYVDERYRQRSFAEGKLVEIMERCWEADPQKRADIFEVVRFLRDAVSHNRKKSEPQ